jgi:threonine/homoserine/homoserine lactone efflux protein
MPSPEVFAAFAGASLALLIVPGPSVLYIVTRSIDQGRSAGLVSVLGIHTGTIVHVAAAALGLSAILASSAVSFQVVKYAGAAYLIWLGVKALRERHQEASEGGDRERSLGRIYAQGVVVNVLNPKTALFFLAFLPQFVDVGEPVTPQVLVLGLTFILLGFVSDGSYALASARVARTLAARRRPGAARRWLPGLTLIGLGVAAAVTGRRPASG